MTRAKEIAPPLPQAAFASARWEQDMLTSAWRLSGARMNLLANLSPRETPRPQNVSPGRPIWGEEVPETLPPWSVYWGIGDA